MVSTEVPGANEILDGGRYGSLVPIGSPEALAQAMAAALDDPGGEAGLRRRAMDFSDVRSVENYERLLAE